MVFFLISCLMVIKFVSTNITFIYRLSSFIYRFSISFYCCVLFSKHIFKIRVHELAIK